MRPLALIVALGLAAPALAAPPKAPPKEAPARDARPATPAVDDRLAAIDTQLAQGDWKGATDAAGAILDDASATASHGAAWVRLGAALHKGGYAYAALTALAEGARLAPQAAAPSYGDLLDLADRLDEEIWVGGLVGGDFSVPMDAATRGRVAYVAAKALFEQGSWGQALGLLPLVPDDAPYALDAEVLRGVAYAQQNRYSDALVPLLTSYEAARTAGRDAHYVATLALNVARTFYAQGNFARAMEYYDKVPRSDASWPLSHVERAWAHFRVDDMPGTVALLTTHQSPFFADGYWPEAAMLRAQALYLMCKFGEVESSIETFRERYAPVKKALDASVGAMDAGAALDDARRLRAGEATRLPRSVIERFGTEARIADTLLALDVAAGELARLRTSGGEGHARRALEARRTARVAAEGGRVLEAARSASADLDEMLADLELTLVDIGSQFANLYQQAAATGETLDLESDAQVRELRKKGKRVWPFEGEYWADELGWYRVVARPECPESLRRSK